MIAIILLFVLSAIPAMIANSKGKSFALWYIYAFLILPIAFVHSLLVKDQRQGQSA